MNSYILYPVFNFNKSFKTQFLENKIENNTKFIFNTLKSLKNKGIEEKHREQVNEDDLQLKQEDDKIKLQYKINDRPIENELTNSNQTSAIDIAWNIPENDLAVIDSNKTIYEQIDEINKKFATYLFDMIDSTTSKIDIADFIKNIMSNYNFLNSIQEFEFTEDLTNFEKLFIIKTNFIRNKAINRYKAISAKETSKVIISTVSSIPQIASSFEEVLKTYKDILINLYSNFINILGNTKTKSSVDVVKMSYILANVEIGIAKGINSLYPDFCIKYQQLQKLIPQATFETLIYTVFECFKHDEIFENKGLFKGWYNEFNKTKTQWTNQELEGKSTVIEREFKLFIDTITLQSVNNETKIPQFPIHVNCFKFKFLKDKQIIDYINSPAFYITYSKILPKENVINVFDNRENFNEIIKSGTELKVQDLKPYYIPIEIYENFIKFLIDLIDGSFIDTEEICKKLFCIYVDECVDERGISEVGEVVENNISDISEVVEDENEQVSKTLDFIDSKENIKTVIINLQKISATFLKCIYPFTISCLNFIDNIVNKREINNTGIYKAICNVMNNKNIANIIKTNVLELSTALKDFIATENIKLKLKPILRDTIIILTLHLNENKEKPSNNDENLLIALSYLIKDNKYYYSKLGNYRMNPEIDDAENINEIETFLNKDTTKNDVYAESNYNIYNLYLILKHFNTLDLYKLLFDTDTNIFESLKYNPLVCMLNKDNIISTFYKEKHLENFKGNFDEHGLLNPRFMFEIEEINKRHELKTDYSTTSMLNELVFKHSNTEDKICGLMFFDIEDIEKGKFFYSDIDCYMNLLIDDIVDNFIKDFEIYSNGDLVEDVDKTFIKNICRAYYVVTANCASKHGISYHAYLPIWCRYADLRKFIQKRKAEHQQILENTNRYCVYDFVDELVYGDYVSNIRMMFYGKGVNNMNFKSINKNELENSERKSIFENETMLNFAESITNNYNKYNKFMLNQENLDLNVESIINAESTKVIISKINNNNNLEINNIEFSKDKYEKTIAIGKKMLGMPLALLHRNLLKHFESINVVNKRNNVHLFFRTGNMLYNIKDALAYTFIGIKPEIYVEVKTSNDVYMTLENVLRNDTNDRRLLEPMERLRDRSEGEINTRDYENGVDIRYYTVSMK